MVGKDSIWSLAGRSEGGECLMPSLRGKGKQNPEDDGVLAEEICVGPPGFLVYFLSKQDFGADTEEDSGVGVIGLL